MRTNHFYRHLDPTQARVLAAVQKPEKFLQRARPVLQLYEQAIQDFIAHHNQTAKPLTWTYTVEKLERKLATNSREPGLREEVVSAS